VAKIARASSPQTSLKMELRFGFGDGFSDGFWVWEYRERNDI